MFVVDIMYHIHIVYTKVWHKTTSTKWTFDPRCRPCWLGSLKFIQKMNRKYVEIYSLQMFIENPLVLDIYPLVI